MSRSATGNVAENHTKQAMPIFPAMPKHPARSAIRFYSRLVVDFPLSCERNMRGHSSKPALLGMQVLA